MSANAKEQLMAFAFVCDEAGSVREILYDGLGISAGASPTSTFAELIHPDSAEKARAFLNMAREQEAVFGWELNIVIQSEIKLLHFAGCIVDEGLLIIRQQPDLAWR